MTVPEMEAPPQIEPGGLGDYLDVMSKAVFQSGMSWRVVESKWPGTREAFRGFDVEQVAEMDEGDIDALASDQRIIRNRRKIEAIVTNAARMLERDAEHGSFREYLRSQPDFDATVAMLRKDFKFLGDFGCYYFLYVVGEHVPSHEEFQERQAPARARATARRRR